MPSVPTAHNFENERLADTLEEHKRREGESGKGDNHWQEVSLEEFLKENAEKFDCEACPAKSEIFGIFMLSCYLSHATFARLVACQTDNMTTEWGKYLLVA